MRWPPLGRTEDAHHCAEGKGFLQKSPSKEPHFTDVSWAARGDLGDCGEVGHSDEVLWGQQWEAMRENATMPHF